MSLQPSAISGNGWQYYSTCVCGGIRKYKYRHPDKPGYELEWWVKVFQFKVTYKNKSVTRPLKIAEMDKTLKEL